MKRWILILGLLLGSCVTQATPTEEASLPTETLAAMETSAGSPQPAATKLPQQSATAQPGPVTLIALGDSLTQGDGDDTGLGYPGRLLKKVNIIRPDTTLLNLGQSGWSSDALIAGDLGLESQLTQAIQKQKQQPPQADIRLPCCGSAAMIFGISTNMETARSKASGMT